MGKWGHKPPPFKLSEETCTLEIYSRASKGDVIARELLRLETQFYNPQVSYCISLEQENQRLRKENKFLLSLLQED